MPLLELTLHRMCLLDKEHAPHLASVFPCSLDRLPCLCKLCVECLESRSCFRQRLHVSVHLPGAAEIVVCRDASIVHSGHQCACEVVV